MKIKLDQKAKNKEQQDKTQHEKIQQIVKCKQEDLIKVLDTIDKSNWKKKEDILKWAPVLNRFDDILEQNCKQIITIAQNLSKNDTIQKTTTPNPELIVKILSFSSFLIENTKNGRSRYNSIEHISTLLNSENSEIVLNALRVIISLVKRDTQWTNTSTISDNLEIQRNLLAFSFGWGPNSLKMIYSGKPLDKKLLSRGSTLHFEVYNESYYIDQAHKSSSKQPSDKVDQKKKKKKIIKRKPKNEITVIDVKDVQMDDCDSVSLFKKLVQTHSIPEVLQFELWTRIRLCYAFKVPEERLKWTIIRLYSIAILGFVSSDMLKQLFHHQPELIEEIAYLLHFENKTPKQVSEAAILALSALALSGIKIPTTPPKNLSASVLTALIPPLSYHGILSNLIRSTKENIHKGSKDLFEDVTFQDALFGLLNSISSIPLGAKSLQESGLMNEIIPLLKLEKIEAERIISKCLNLIDVIMRTNKLVLPQLIQMGILDDIIKLVQSRTEIVNEKLQKLDKQKQETRKVQDLLDIYQYKVYISSMKILNSMVHSRSATVNARELLEGVLLKTLNFVLENPQYYGGYLYTLAGSILSGLVNNDPASLPVVYQSGTLKIVLKTLKENLPPHSEVIYTLSSLLNTLCLNNTGLEEVTKFQPFQYLFNTLMDAKYEKVITLDGTTVLGGYLNEFLRHHQSLRGQCIESSVKHIEQLISQFEKAKINLLGRLDEQQERLYESLIKTCFLISSILKNNQQLSKAFIDKGGCKSLVKLSITSIARSTAKVSDGFLRLFRSLCSGHSGTVFKELIDSSMKYINEIPEITKAVESNEELSDKQLIPLNTLGLLLYRITKLFTITNAPYFTDWNKNKGKEILPPLGKLDCAVRWRLSLEEVNESKMSNEKQNQGFSKAQILKGFSEHIRFLYEILEKAIVGGVRQFESRTSSQPPTQHAIQLANLLATNMFHYFATFTSLSGNLERRCLFIERIVRQITPILFNIQRKQTNTLLLNEFNKTGGMEKLLSIFESLLQEILENQEPVKVEVIEQNKPLVEISTKDDMKDDKKKEDKKKKVDLKEPEKPATEKAMISFLQLLQKAVSMSYLVNSPLTSSMMLSTTSKFDASTFLKEIQKKVANPISMLWKHKNFKNLSEEAIMLFVNIVGHIVKGADEDGLDKLKKQVTAKKPITPDPHALKQIQDMGFSLARATDALIRCNNNINMAAEWLLSNAEPEINEEEDELARAIKLSLEGGGDNENKDKMEVEEIDYVEIIKKDVLDWILNMLEKSKKLIYPCTDVLSILCETGDTKNVVKTLVTKLKSTKDKTEQQLYLLNCLAQLKNKPKMKDAFIDKEISAVEEFLRILSTLDELSGSTDSEIAVAILQILESLTVRPIFEKPEDVDKVTIDMYTKETQKLLLSDSECRKLLSYCIKLSENSKITPEILKGLLKIISNITVSYEIARECIKQGYLEKLISTKADLRFKNHANLVQSILRRTFEDDDILLQGMEAEIIRTLPALAISQGRVTPKLFLQQFTRVIERNPSIFFKATKNVCTMKPGSSVIDLKPESSRNHVKVNEESIEPMKKVIESLLNSVVMRPYYPNQKKDTKKEKGKEKVKDKTSSSEPENSAKKYPALARYNLIKFVADFVVAYKSCSDIVLKFENEKIEKYNGTNKLLSFLIREILPYPCNPSLFLQGRRGVFNEENTRYKMYASRMTSYLLCALLAQHSSLVLSEISNTLDDITNVQKPMRTIHAIADFIHGLLMNKSTSKSNTKEMVKLIVKHNIVTGLTSSLNAIDLNHPDAYTVANAVLKPLEMISKITGASLPDSDQEKKLDEKDDTPKKSEKPFEEFIELDYLQYRNEYNRMESDVGNYTSPEEPEDDSEDSEDSDLSEDSDSDEMDVEEDQAVHSELEEEHDSSDEMEERDHDDDDGEEEHDGEEENDGEEEEHDSSDEMEERDHDDDDGEEEHDGEEENDGEEEENDEEPHPLVDDAEEHDEYDDEEDYEERSDSDNLFTQIGDFRDQLFFGRRRFISGFSNGAEIEFTEDIPIFGGSRNIPTILEEILHDSSIRIIPSGSGFRASGSPSVEYEPISISPSERSLNDDRPEFRFLRNPDNTLPYDFSFSPYAEFVNRRTRRTPPQFALENALVDLISEKKPKESKEKDEKKEKEEKKEEEEKKDDTLEQSQSGEEIQDQEMSDDLELQRAIELSRQIDESLTQETRSSQQSQEEIITPSPGQTSSGSGSAQTDSGERSRTETHQPQNQENQSNSQTDHTETNVQSSSQTNTQTTTQNTNTSTTRNTDSNQQGQSQQQQGQSQQQNQQQQLNIDPTFLAALPDDLRQEVLSQAIATLVSNTSTQEGQSSIPQEFLSALPQNIQQEVLEQERILRQAQQRQLQQQNQQSSSGPSEIDAASFIASLTPELREEVLLTTDESVLQQLPAEMAAEAYAAREQYYQRQQRRRARETSSLRYGIKSHLDNLKEEKKGKPLVEKNTVVSLIRLLYISKSLTKQVEISLLNLSQHPETRKIILYLLLGMLENHTITNVPSELSKVILPRLYGVPSIASTNLEETSSSVVPIEVLKRVLSVLTYLTKNNPRVLAKMVTVIDSTEQKQKNLAPVSKLFTLLSASYFTKNSQLVDQLLSLLDVSCNYLTQNMAQLNTEISTRTENIERLKKTELTQKETSKAESSEKKKESKQITEEKPSLEKEKQEKINKEKDMITKLEKEKLKLHQQITVFAEDTNIRQIVKILVQDDCSEQTAKHSISIIIAIATNVPESKSLILKELSSIAIEEAKKVITYLDPTPFKKLSKKVMGDKSELPKESIEQSLRQQKFCRILKAYCSVLAAESKKEDASKDEGESKKDEKKEDKKSEERKKEPYLLQQDSLDFVWDAIEKYLEVITQIETSPSSALISQLLPLIEAYFSFHEEFEKKKEEKDTSSPKTPKLAPHIYDRKKEPEKYSKVEQFLEKNRTILNTIIRANPNLLHTTLSLMIKYPKYIDFDNKRVWFRTKLRQDQQRNSYGTIRLHVRRDHIFVDSYYHLRRRTPNECKGKLNVRFADEEGVDAGGLTREWFLELSKAMFNQDYALFIQSADKATFQPNPASYINPDHLSFFKFIGRVIAMAIYNQKLLDCYFTRSFYKHILGIPITYHDIEGMDPDFYKSLKWMLENDITNVIFQTFTAEADEFGKRKIVELKPGGAKINVTNENKEEYVKLITELKMTTAIKAQLQAFLESFYEIIPKKWISIFNENELELLISGLPDINIDDLEKNTEYYGYTKSSQVIQWFWKIVRSFNKQEKAALVQFVTGTSKIPLDGFKNLRGMSGIQRFNIHRVPGDDQERLPTAHTCFNQLDLPAYQSEEILQERLLLAIRECSSGFGFV